jgi:phosphoglycolate phosphatase
MLYRRLYRRLYWDLDGTLTDPRQGIVGCVTHALRTMGIEPVQETLDRFIGPPLRQGFERSYGLRGEELERAVALYRQRFDAVGWRENRLIAGIAALLEELAAAGVPMAVATSKPAVFAERILAAFGIRRWFHAVYGATLDGRIEGKRAVLGAAVAAIGQAERRGSAMIGDHPDDIEAAHGLGLEAVAVAYGYGTAEDLARTQPEHTVADAQALRCLLVGGLGR